MKEKEEEGGKGRKERADVEELPKKREKEKKMAREEEEGKGEEQCKTGDKRGEEM